MHSEYAVSDIMTVNPAKIGPRRTVREAAQKMHEDGVGSLLVVDGFLMGIVTEKDVVIHIAHDNGSSNEVVIDDIMTPTSDLITIEPSRSVIDAIELMKSEDVRRLPVVLNQQLHGIITRKDILRIESSLFDLIQSDLHIREFDRKKNNIQ